MSRLSTVRLLLCGGILVSLISWSYTVSHLSDPTFLLIEKFELGQTHGYYHTFREAIGDVAAIAILLLLFFGPDHYRTPLTWSISLILVIGYYAPFWIGMPFDPALSAPNLAAEIIHIVMAALTVSAVLLAKPVFSSS